MRDQLRIYTLQPGVFDEFYAYWKANIVPAREASGFRILAAWRRPESDEFIWIVRWPEESSFEAADAAYYESPQRMKTPRSSGRFVQSSEVRLLDPLQEFTAVCG